MSEDFCDWRELRSVDRFSEHRLFNSVMLKLWWAFLYSRLYNSVRSDSTFLNNMIRLFVWSLDISILLLLCLKRSFLKTFLFLNHNLSMLIMLETYSSSFEMSVFILLFIQTWYFFVVDPLMILFYESILRLCSWKLLSCLEIARVAFRSSIEDKLISNLIYLNLLRLILMTVFILRTWFFEYKICIFLIWVLVLSFVRS